MNMPGGDAYPLQGQPIRGATRRLVGQLEGLTDVIGIDVTQAGETNRRTVRAYLCDGEAGGDALWYSGVMVGNNIRLISADGKSTLGRGSWASACSGSYSGGLGM